MIPALLDKPCDQELYLRFLTTLAAAGFAGEVSMTEADRTVLATDNSMYPIPPQAIIFPCHIADVCLAMRLAELSTSNRATIGGMINTDASGQGSVIYGKTRDHVLELTSVLLGGDAWHSHPIDDGELATLRARTDRIGELHRVLDDIHRQHAPEIERRFPKLNRCLTGYDPAHVRDERGRFNLNSVLCGAEVERQLALLVADLEGTAKAGRQRHSVVRGDSVARVWTLRKRAAGMLGNMSGERRPAQALLNALRGLRPNGAFT